MEMFLGRGEAMRCDVIAQSKKKKRGGGRKPIDNKTIQQFNNLHTNKLPVSHGISIPY